MSEEWNIRPRDASCRACQIPFVDGQSYFTRLVFDASDYERGDFCESCWTAEAATRPRYSSWKGVFRMPPAEPDRRIKKETAESLLRQLLEQNDPARRNAVYILAVMLERQRVLVERDVRVLDGVRTIFYEHRKTGETFAIHDPQLRLTELEPVQAEIMTLLGTADAPASVAPAPSPAPAETAAPADAATTATPHA